MTTFVNKLLTTKRVLIIGIFFAIFCIGFFLQLEKKVYLYYSDEDSVKECKGIKPYEKKMYYIFCNEGKSFYFKRISNKPIEIKEKSRLKEIKITPKKELKKLIDKKYHFYIIKNRGENKIEIIPVGYVEVLS